MQPERLLNSLSKSGLRATLSGSLRHCWSAFRDTIDAFGTTWDYGEEGIDDSSLHDVDYRPGLYAPIADEGSSPLPAVTQDTALHQLPSMPYSCSVTAYSAMIDQELDPLVLLAQVALEDREATMRGKESHEDGIMSRSQTDMGVPDFSETESRHQCSTVETDSALYYMAHLGSLVELADSDKHQSHITRHLTHGKRQLAEAFNDKDDRLLEYWRRYNREAPRHGMMPMPADLPSTPLPLTPTHQSSYDMYCYAHGVARSRHRSGFIAWQATHLKLQHIQERVIKHWTHAKKSYIAPIGAFQTDDQELEESVMISVLYPDVRAGSIVDYIAHQWLELGDGINVIMVWLYTDIGLPLMARRAEIKYLELLKSFGGHENALGFQYGELVEDEPEDNQDLAKVSV